MATSLVGPALTARALAAAPVPRPPQPTRATWRVLLSAPGTRGMVTPARTEAAATPPDILSRSRRVRLLGGGLSLTRRPLVGGRKLGGTRVSSLAWYAAVRMAVRCSSGEGRSVSAAGIACASSFSGDSFQDKAVPGRRQEGAPIRAV